MKLYQTAGTRLRTRILSVIYVFALGTVAFGQMNADELSPTEKLYIASRIYAVVKLYFTHGQGMNIDGAYQYYLDQILTTSGRKEFALETAKFVATLKNGHTQIFDAWLANTYGQPFPFWMDEVEGKWIVTSSQLPTLKRGSVVRELDGRPINDVMDEKVQYVPASNERLARSHILNHPFLFPKTFVLTLEDGSKVQVERGVTPNASGNQAAKTAGRWLTENKVAYIKIPSFGNPDYERTALELEAPYHHATTLIIDVRGNGGGQTPWQLIGALMNKPWRTWSAVTLQHIALFEAQGQAASMFLGIPNKDMEPDPHAYSGRLIFLVDRYCGSACEDLVMPFKDNGRATIIGETTQGSTGQPYRIQLHEGITLMVGSLRCSFPDGSEFESVGIEPTIPVQTKVADILDSRDRVLEKAEQVAEK